MRIIDFSPNLIQENTTSKILIIIESYLNFQNLKLIENNLKLKLGDDITMPCQVINSTTISSIIPYMTNREIILEIHLGMDCISICNPELKLKIKENKIINETKISNNNIQINNKSESLIFLLKNSEIFEKIKLIFDDLKCILNFYNNSKSSVNINSSEYFNEDLVIKELEFILNEFNKNENINKKRLIYKYDQNGYNLIHYICAINYYKVLDTFAKFKIKLSHVSKDNLTPYEICAGKWNMESTCKLIELIDNIDNDELIVNNNSDNIDRTFYNIDILKSALNLALDLGKSNYNKNVLLVELLLKQIKIQFTVDSTSGHIINTLNHNMDQFYQFSNGKDENAKFIQKYVRRWLRRSQYNGIKKATRKLQMKIKNFAERKKFLNIKNATIKIQKLFRDWIKKKLKK